MFGDVLTVHIRKLCPYYDLLERIFGDKSNITPLFLADNLNVCENESQEGFDAIDSTNGNDVNHQERNCIEYLEEEYVTDEIQQNSTETSSTVVYDTDDNAMDFSTVDIDDWLTPDQQSTPSSNNVRHSSDNSSQSLNQQRVKSNSAEKVVSDASVSRFRHTLLSLPESSEGFKVSKRHRPPNAADVLSEALKLRAEAIREKIEHESMWKKEELAISQEKMELDKELRLKEMELRKAEMESNERIKMAEINANNR